MPWVFEEELAFWFGVLVGFGVGVGLARGICNTEMVVCFGAEDNRGFLPVAMLDLQDLSFLAARLDGLPWHGWISVFDLDVGSVDFGAGYGMLVFWKMRQVLPLWGNFSPWEGFWVFIWGFLWEVLFVEFVMVEA